MKNINSNHLVFVFGLLLMAPFVWAQADSLINGVTSSNTVKRIQVGADGVLAVQTPCPTVVDAVTTVGTAVLPVPATIQTARKMVLICNSPENTGSPVVKCRADGVAPVMGLTTPGQGLAKGDCITYSTTSVVNCIADTASTAVSSTECK